MLEDIFTYFDDISTYYAVFREEKKRINAILKSGGDFPNDGPLDDEIKGLVYAINKLPFVYTSSSCAGHFRTGEDLIRKYGDKRGLRLPKEGFGRYFDGRIGFVFKPEKDSREMIEQISDIVNRYESAAIDDRPPLIHTDNSSLQGLRFVALLDTIQRDTRRVPQLIIAAGQARRTRVKHLINDLYELTGQYGWAAEKHRY